MIAFLAFFLFLSTSNSALRRKELTEFHDPAITGQILFFCARNPDMIVGCLSSSTVFRIGKTRMKSTVYRVRMSNY